MDFHTNLMIVEAIFCTRNVKTFYAEEMVAELQTNEGRVSRAVLAVVLSRQFRYIRGAQSQQAAE